MYKDGALKTNDFFQAARSLKLIHKNTLCHQSKTASLSLFSFFFSTLGINDTEIQNHFQTIFGTDLNLNLKHVVQARDGIL